EREIGEPRLLHLVGCGDGEFVYEGEVSGSLEVGKVLEATLLDRGSEIETWLDAVGKHHAGHHFFIAQIVRNRYDGDLLHRRMAGERRLDLERGDVLAGAADDVFDPVDEMQRAVLATAHRVAGVEPATLPRFLGRGRVFQIARKKAAPRITSPVPDQK